MSGAWAREADNAREHMLGRTDLAAAAWYLIATLSGSDEFRPLNLRRASAIIRRERRRLDPDGRCSRKLDWAGSPSDENLIWAALRSVATISAWDTNPQTEAWHLREAEAALRTLHKRGRS